MPLHDIEELELFFEGKQFAARRLIFRIGFGGRLYQVLEFEGRQIVDEGAYREGDREQMVDAARELLLESFVHGVAC